MNMRPVTIADAEKGCRILRRSIAELCHADHGGDPAFIATWTANKTPDSWLAWMSQPGASLLVAERDAETIGVGMVDAKGMILLNYVAPEARYQGVSTALLRAMEDTSTGRGIATCRLESTKTAQQFYISRGYGRVARGNSTIMAKHLV